MKRNRIKWSSRRAKRSFFHPRRLGIETLEARLALYGTTLQEILSCVQAAGATCITPINQAPYFTKGKDQTVLEGAGTYTVSRWATGISAGSIVEQVWQQLNFVVTTDNPQLFSSAPKINSDGTLIYALARDVNGVAHVGVRLMDNGGTAYGGIDSSPLQSFSISVTPVNDRPVFSGGKDQTVLEDGRPPTVAKWAKNIAAGPANESSQTVAFLASNDNPSLFSSPPAISPDGKLRFSTAPNANGKAKVTVRLKDDGGTANRGLDTSEARTFTITVKPVNDAPTFVKGQDQFVPKGGGNFTVPAWATAISAGPANESRQQLSFLVSTNQPSLFKMKPTISAKGTLSFQPNRGASGTAIVTVRLKDDGGTTDGGQNISRPQSFTINIGSLPNVPPSFTKGANQVVPEDSGPWSIPDWATAISVGPVSEAKQTAHFIVSNDNAALFTKQPAIAPNGALAYTLAPNANGAATVTVKLQDNGGTANGGKDTSPAQTFTIKVAPVNDAPSFLKGADQQVQSSAAAVTVSGWASAITPGPSDEFWQELLFRVQPENSSLFTVQPAIAADGTLSFTPAVGAGGVTTVSVQLRDNGGTDNNGQDTSPLQQFTIDISPAAEAPLIDAALLNDTAPAGQTNRDGITFDPTIAGAVYDPLGVASLTGAIDQGAPVAITVNADGGFVFDPPLLRDGTADGRRIAHFVARNPLGTASSFDLSFTLDASAPPAPALVLSAASGVVGAQISNASRVTLQGTTEPGIGVTLIQPAINALANSAGNFQFNSVPLMLGENVFTAIATDLAGNTTQTPTTIQRVNAAATPDPVLLWNQTVRQAIRTDARDPTRASRDMAMVQAAIYDVVNAIENRAGYYVTLPAPGGASLEAAISGAAHQVLTYLFPAQHNLFDAVLTTSLANVPDGATETSSVSFGRQVGNALIALRANDGWDQFVEHVPANEPGRWQPTEPMYVVALDPQWATLQPWAMTSPDQFLPPGPPSLGSQEWADAYNETKVLGAYNSTARTADQTQITRFWADGPGTSTPPGHWNLVAEKVATAAGNSIAENARLFALLNITLADAAIAAWNAKYTDDFWRPITAIQNGGADGNDLTIADPAWQPFLITPPFPEYVSGHSTFSGAAAAVLTAQFGSDYAFSTASEGLLNVTRSFASFDAAAAEAGRSRIYGGIHYEFSNADGQAAGKALANYVLKTFDTTADTIAPRVFFETDSDQALKANASFAGRVLDNLSGVASLTASVDSGPEVPVLFDALGRFTFGTSLPLDQTADGVHAISFVAVDASGNASDPTSFTFTLDTAAPTLDIESPLAGASLAAGDMLTGTVGTSGSPIVAISYAFAGQPIMAIAFNAQTGQFSAPLDLAKLAPGVTTVTVSARDAAGNVTTSAIHLTLATRVEFNIARFTPLDGAQEVGTTYRPQVFFSRPVNPASLSSTNFYATGPSGAQLAANIVPSGDGTFAWLFFTEPLPSSSRITVHLDGATILAANDGTPLDADGNGSAGGQFTFTFSTVSLVPLVGTSLSGKVLDVGPDLKPMTFDDIRVGPDQVMHTADDLFLLPIAGVKVFIVGLESQFVLTDASGTFHFDSVPAGDVKLAIDGRTATNAPSGVFFPEMVMDLMLDAGRANTVMGTMGTADQKEANRDRSEVYLPRLQASILQNVSNTAATTITVGADAAANLTAEQRSMLTLNVLPGSLRDQNGNPVTTGQVGISTVPPSLVREMLPPGLLQHTFDITVQSPGITNFATPAPMTFPNLFGAKPGEKLNFLSFDHTTGRLVIEGSATVSSDGLSVSTDPNTGITHPGWHGLTPQGSPTKPDNNDDDIAVLGTEFKYTIKTEVVSDDPAAPPLVAASALGAESEGLRAATVVVSDGVTDHLLTKSKERIRFSVTNNTNPKKSDGSYLRVVFTVNPTYAHKFLDGLGQTSFKLTPGQEAKFDFDIKEPNILKLENDVLIGVKYRLEVTNVAKNGITTPLNETGEYFAYRYVDAMDDNSNDSILKFASTIADAAGGAIRSRPVEYRGDPDAYPKLSFPPEPPNTTAFIVTELPLSEGFPLRYLEFDPKQIADGISARLIVQTPETPKTPPRVVQGFTGRTPYELRVTGNGVGKRTLYFNYSGLLSQLESLANNVVKSQDIDVQYTLAPGQRNAPGKLQLAYGTQKTSILDTPATEAAIRTALEPLTGGVGSISVSLDHTEKEIEKGPRKGSIDIDNRYTVTFTTPSAALVRLSAKDPTNSGKVTLKASYDVNDKTSGLSIAELALIDTLQKRKDFADEVFRLFQKAFAPFPDEVVIERESAAAPYNIRWTTSSEELFGATLVTTGVDELLEKFHKNRTKQNVKQQGFVLADALGRTNPHPSEVYVDNHFEFTYPYWESPFELVTQELALTAAHELGHSFGLPHSAKAETESTNEVQVISLTGGESDDEFSLSFAGETTAHPIRRNSSASQFLEALGTMPVFGNVLDQLLVAGSVGGPYTVYFVNPNKTFTTRTAFGGVDVPQITGIGTRNLQVTGSTTKEGKVKVTSEFNIRTHPSAGQEDSLYDIMNSGNSGVPTTFQELVSGAALHFSFRGNWRATDTTAYASVLANVLKGREIDFARDAPAYEGQKLLDTFDFAIDDGPLLELFDDGSQLIPDTVDFGQASTFVPAVRHFSLVNLGSENATIRSVKITRGNAAFSVPTIPVTVLQPGKSLDFDVTFAPDAVLAYEGSLAIDSDVDGFRGTYDLIGDGHPPNTPAIKLDFYNNLQAVLVGVQTSFAGGENHGNLTNVGTAPLIISNFRIAAGQGFGEWTTASLTQPITLAPGESTGIPFSFRASKVGLRPGTIEVLSNDPRTPILRVPVVATGVNFTTSQSNIDNYAGVDVGNDYVAVGDMLSYQNNLPDLRTKSDDRGNWEFFLPANTGVQVNTYDPVSGLIATSLGFTNASGVITKLNRANFVPSNFPDTDGDGLPDDVEFAVGTNPNQFDTDGDGTNDFAELDTGSNPSDDRPTANGIVSALATGSTALDIKLAADFRDASRSVAYIASGNSGLTVADVTNFAQPITLAQLGLPGVVDNVSLDVVRRLVAAASPTGGVHLIDVADPTRPTLLRTIAHEGTDPVAAVELYDGIIYIGVGGKIRSFDVQSGELTSDFALGTQRVLGMSRSGDRLYATLLDTANSQRLLRIFDISTAGLTASGSLVLPGITTVGDPYVADGVAWIPAGDRVVTVNVSAAQSPQLIQAAGAINQGGVADIELNGSGLGVIAGFVNPSGSAIVLQTPNPQSTNQVFTRFTLPSFGQAVALNSGLAYIADGASGLQLVNFLQRDTGNIPPTISLDALLGDLNTNQPGLQLYEGTSVTIGNRISDDVQVRKVELLIDGTVVRTELSFPYDLTTVLPTRAQSGNQAVLQVRATDSGGNSSLSDPIVIDLTADTTAPTISTLDPASGSTQPISRRKVTLKFSEPLALLAAVPTNFVLQGPSGPITPISIDLRQRDTQIEILYPPLAQATYTFITHAPLVKDRAGNPLGAADLSSTFTVAPAVFVPTIRWVNDAGGDWGTAGNWRDVATNASRLPTATDDVLIDVPTDPLITLSEGVVTVNSLVSNERFQINGGITTPKPVSPRLNVATTAQVNNTFVLSGFTSYAPATFSGTLLRGSGGQGLTISGYSRLASATIQTDVTVNNDTTANQFNSQVWIAGGLAVEGTFNVAAPGIAIWVEGTQTWSSGTFLTTGQTVAQRVTIGSVGTSTLTIGENVTFQAQVIFATGFGPALAPGTTPIPHVLSLINRGTITAPGSPTQFFGIITQTESFTNLGTINTQDRGVVSIQDKIITNAATGRISISNGQYLSTQTGVLGGSTTTNLTNAGTIELNNVTAAIMTRSDGLNQNWSNTGTIILNKSLLTFSGSFTSDDVVNVRSTSSFVGIYGQMDNTGRTFTFNTQTGSYTLGPGGRIKGGTLVMGGPTARLEFGGVAVGTANPVGVLNGVTLQGDVAIGGLFTNPISGVTFINTGYVRVENGLTLNGTISFYKNSSTMEFVGPAQTVSGGTFQFFPSSNFSSTGSEGMRAITGGTVTLDSAVTLRSSGGARDSDSEKFRIFGNFISNAAMVIDANSAILLGGFHSATGPVPFINRGTITVPASRSLTLDLPFTNEGQIVVNGGTVETRTPGDSLDYTSTFKNTGTINLAGNGLLRLRTNQSATVYRTADLGTILDSGGTVAIESGIRLDNSGATLVIDGTANWRLFRESQIVGGTIQVDSTAKLVFSFGILKDVTVNGNSSDNFNDLVLVGDLDFNGNIAGNLQFGDNSLYAGVPLILRGGNFDLGFRTITGASGAPSVSLEADVVFKGYRTNATFTQPLTNRGQILASPFAGVFFDADRLFHFTAAPITNEGTLSAINRGILRINNLAAPNSGVVSAAVESRVEFTGAFAQSATGTTRVDISGTGSSQFGLLFGSVIVGGAATLDGTLEVQFASGYTPAVGNTFKVLTYASRTGTFATLNVTGLANGLTLTPQYNGSDLTLIVGSAGGGGAGGAASLTNHTLAIGAALEQLFPATSKTLAPAAATNSPYLIDPVNESPSTGILKSSSGITPDSLITSESIKFASRDDSSAAIDELFAAIDLELFLIKTKL